MKLIFWNTSYSSGNREAQVAALRRRRPDIVVLAELGRGHVQTYAESLSGLGLDYWRDSARHVETPPPGQERNLNLLVASRWPLADLEQIDVPWPERALSVLVRTPWRPVELHAVHMPTGVGWGLTKTFEAVYTALAHRTRRPRILCGDFNSPQEELRDGRVISFAYERRKDGSYRLRPERGERWGAGELSVITGLRRFDLGDVFRTLYGPRKVAYSWYPRWSHNRGGRRFDHVFAPAGVTKTRPARPTTKSPENPDHSLAQVQIACWGRGRPGLRVGRARG